uniref:DUF1248 domain-containing protein n=1 Tax=Caenorhabditis japonica TaxID=281687 RepID=A0A8R1ECV1_CAEJA
MAWIPEKYRGKEILKVITQYLKETEHMKTKNMLACNVHWSQNFWKQATGNSDMSSCIYYISYYDVNDLKLASDCDIGSHGVVVKVDYRSDDLQYTSK